MNRNTGFINLARLTLFQISLGIIYFILTDTLNRVMTIELSIAAWIVGSLIGIREIMALIGIKIWAGNLSDKTHFLGYKRTPFILGGLLASAISFYFIAPTAFEVQSNYMLGILKLLIAFTIFGIGYNASLTAYYALIADIAGEKNIPKVAAMSWTLMVLGGIVTSVLMSSYLKEFSEERFVSALQTASLISIAIGFVTIIGVEDRTDESIKNISNETLTFLASLKLINASPLTKKFAFYIFISIFAAFGTELILEPFGADVLGLSVSETTKFRQYLGLPQLLFMILTGFIINRFGIKKAVLVGNAVATVGYTLLISAGVFQLQKLLIPSLILVGVGLGFCTVGNIVMMMMMNAGRSGLYVGLWGTAQSLAMFLSGTGVGAIRDIMLHFFANPMMGYTIIFLLVIGAFTISTSMLPSISKENFEAESKVKLEEVLATAAD
ncbi:MAG: BCD family MFS transporter [Chloroherpetonaceae bacterium]|nr:BCD family MFS transporter [Chloroherpetonaceae bacterium]